MNKLNLIGRLSFIPYKGRRGFTVPTFDPSTFLYTHHICYDENAHNKDIVQPNNLGGVFNEEK